MKKDKVVRQVARVLKVPVTVGLNVLAVWMHVAEKKNNVEKISATELQQLMQRDGDVLVVNVLSPEYFADCHIKGSINVPLLDLQRAVLDWDRNKKVVIYCAHKDCRSSSLACAQLKKMGFVYVYWYEGGVKEWRNLGYPYEGLCKMEYLFNDLRSF